MVDVNAKRRRDQWFSRKLLRTQPLHPSRRALLHVKTHVEAWLNICASRKNLARYAWVNADNVPVKSGVGVPLRAAMRAQFWPRARWNPRLPPPMVAGVYTLIFGYEIDAQNKSFPAPDFTLDPDSLVDHYDKGQLYRRVESITVVPVAEPTK